jgi:hypothetical protein
LRVWDLRVWCLKVWMRLDLDGRLEGRKRRWNEEGRKKLMMIGMRRVGSPHSMHEDGMRRVGRN